MIRTGHALYRSSKPLPLWLQNALVVTLVLPAILAMMVWTVCKRRR
jgi:hypothetical protein